MLDVNDGGLRFVPMHWEGAWNKQLAPAVSA